MGKSEKNNFYQVLKDISNKIEVGKDLMPDQYITEFQVSAKEVCEQLEEVLNTSRTLRLGIVGEVKAGKSSFLNALLFEGEDILPKAPTPMTAALTKLSYSEKPEAKVFFYNQNDWMAICRNAKKYEEILEVEYRNYCAEYDARAAKRQQVQKPFNVLGRVDESVNKMHPKKTKVEFERDKKSIFPSEVIACKEVYDMAGGLDVNKYLSDEPLIISSEVSNNYMAELQQYVGSNGTYTPIVKYTEIQINNPLLQGIEVVDTPGLNDPILSRSRITSKFLMQCDAVFLLSYSGQFLGKEDISFITSILPSEGINYAVIVGSKFDSGILDYPERNASFKKAKDQSKLNFQTHAKNNLSDYCKTSGNTTKLLDMLMKSDIQFVSSLMYAAGKHKSKGEQFSQEEKHIIERMQQRFSDFKATADALFSLANIDTVRKNSFDKVREDKEDILAERQAGILESQVGKFLDFLENLAIQTESNYSELKDTDVDELESKVEMMTRNLSSVRAKVKGLFDEAVSSVMYSQNDIMLEVSKELKNHTDIIVNCQEEVIEKPIRETERYGFLNLKKRRVTVGYDRKVIKHNVANISDLQKNINEFNIRAMEIINNRFKSMLKIEELKSNIKTVVMEAFEIGNSDFDENAILIPLQSAINQIFVPTLRFDTEKYNFLIDEKLGGRTVGGTINDNDISVLMRAQQEILEKMQKDYASDIEKQCNITTSKLREQSSVFIEGIVNSLEENAEKIKRLLTDKRTSLTKFEKFRDEIKKCKSMLIELNK